MKKKSIGKSRLWVAFVAFALFFGASAVPVKTAVFTGFGPRGRGCVSWLKLVESSPELDLMLVDAAMIRAGALERAYLPLPGNASISFAGKVRVRHDSVREGQPQAEGRTPFRRAYKYGILSLRAENDEGGTQ